MEKDTTELPLKSSKKLGKQVYLLSYISFVADLASEMLYPITPLFLTSVLGANMTTVGLVEGFAELLSQLIKIWGGRLSDRLKKRKIFIISGYLISALAKSAMGFAHSWSFVFLTRALDRVGKGIRTGPRDALLSDSVSPSLQGRAFGFHRGMDTLGAVFGPLIGLGLLAFFVNDLRQVFIWALIPGLASVLISCFIQEASPKTQVFEDKKSRGDFKIPSMMLMFFICWGVFSLANSNDMFLILKIKDAGHTFTDVISLYVMFNLAYALTSPYLGNLSDSIGRKPLLLFGLAIFAIVYFGFAFASTYFQFAVLYCLYGIFNAATEGVGKAWVIDLLPDGDHKATALAYFGATTGVCNFIGSISAGLLWDAGYKFWTFAFGGIGALITFVAFIAIRWPQHQRQA